MPNFTITKNPQTGVYNCVPSSQSISKSAGVTFNASTPCRVCLSNSNVFGVSSLDLAQGNNQPAVTGSVGVSSGFHIQDPGTTCTAGITNEDDPFTVTIGSSDGETAVVVKAPQAKPAKKATAAKKAAKKAAKPAKPAKKAVKKAVKKAAKKVVKKAAKKAAPKKAAKKAKAKRKR